MLTTDEIKKALAGHTLTRVSKETGVNRTTLSALRNGHETNLTQKTLRALSDYLGPDYAD